MWHFGANDGPKVLNADPMAKLGSVLSDDVLKSNGYSKDMPVGALLAKEQGGLWTHGVNPSSMVQFGESGQAPAAAPATSAYSPPSSAAAIPESQITTADQQKQNAESRKHLLEYRDSLSSAVNDANYVNRIGNTHAAYSLLANSPDLQQIVGRYSGADASTMMKAALNSNSVPDFMSSIGHALGSKLPNDNPQALADLYNYLRYAEKEKMYVNNITANPTNQSRLNEQNVAFGLGQPPQSALKGMALSLHDMKLPFEQLSVTNHLLGNGLTNLADVQSHPYYQYAMNEHRLRHEDLSGREVKTKLPTDLDSGAFSIRPYTPPSKAELDKFNKR
jgi:hypothetical protein